MGSRFEVVTDHKPLANIPESIVSERDGTGRRGRWAVELSSFDFSVTTRRGLDHENADALSRRPSDGTPASTQVAGTMGVETKLTKATHEAGAADGGGAPHTASVAAATLPTGKGTGGSQEIQRARLEALATVVLTSVTLRLVIRPFNA